MRFRDERGMALIEAVMLCLVLLVPLMTALGVLSDLQRSAMGATAAVREAGFDSARSSDPASADRAVSTAVRRAFEDHGLDASEARVRWSVQPSFSRGARIEVEVAYPVEVLRIPFLGRVGGPVIWVRARHLARIDRFGSTD